MTTWVLVHSPLLGPRSVEPVAAALGGDVLVPPHRDVGPPYTTSRIAAVRDAVRGSGPVVLVGHSGAGALLPAIGAGLPVAGYLFVDAVLPRPGRTRFDELGPDLEAHLRSKASDGSLPPWHEWFPESPPIDLIAEPEARAAFVADGRPVPLAVFEEPAPEVMNWPNAPCGYLRLSPAYDTVLTRVAAMGWATGYLDAHHLSPYTEPHRVADAMRELLTEIGTDSAV